MYLPVEPMSSPVLRPSETKSHAIVRFHTAIAARHAPTISTGALGTERQRPAAKRTASVTR